MSRKTPNVPNRSTRNSAPPPGTSRLKKAVIAPLSASGPSEAAVPAKLTKENSEMLNLTPQQKRICERVLNVFETGTPEGKYGAISIFADGPNGIRQITYGRSQTTEYDNLRELVAMYVSANGQFSAELGPFVPRIGRTPLVDQARFKQLLRSAGNDPVMHATQDEFFDRRYFRPAMEWAAKHGFNLGLSALVIYDSFIHSGGILDLLRTRFPERPPAQGGKEKKWIEQYVEARHAWLASHSRTILRSTIYRTRCFQAEIGRNNWDLKKLPIMANGVPVGDLADVKTLDLTFVDAFRMEAAELLPYLGTPGGADHIPDPA